ncbi:siderophore-interacting protein [Cronobacter turicensis]|uniref:Siderophore-interacting protein n=2 Tax=Cronobacter turicensis TaxID=413502 RepID=A0A2T7B2T1_9ENTR|nr:siderophore-interacting protein [Cronobacter turicensis]MEB8541256.1 siderophore-interacting protein [Cronobacter sakazakii]EKM0529161.1 siderophore-interacting protein [Cronobacter turicensis]ELQ6001804.1 siderophore-interacting protein [Cronobacter turicensis]ELQ6131061.1 siderophore-interacting protein [Cronobacter turicensis]ELY3554031.1 siderophore-interacting protein [Cronobacter turicensis]
MTASYRIFNVTLRRRIPVTPSLLRCVFTGPDVAHMKHEAPDQRIKLMFARPDGDTARLPVSDSWYQDYLALPRERRPFMRTYTLRALRREACELDVEFVLHGDSGPASRWAMHAKPGDTLQIVAPDRDFPGDSGGYEWSADDALRQALLVADETALPAALGILEQLARKPAPPRVQAFLEVPLAQDIQPLRYPFADIHWLARDENAPHGERLLEAVKDAAALPASEQASAQTTADDDDEETLIWQRAGGAGTFRAWVAAESGAVKRLRHYLTRERQLDPARACFMAYWSRGKSHV